MYNLKLLGWSSSSMTALSSDLLWYFDFSSADAKVILAKLEKKWVVKVSTRVWVFRKVETLAVPEYLVSLRNICISGLTTVRMGALMIFPLRFDNVFFLGGGGLFGKGGGYVEI